MTKEQELLYQIFNKVNELDKKVEVNIVYQKAHDKKLESHAAKLEVLEADKNQAVGKRTVWALFVGSIGGIVTSLMHHISNK